MTTEVAVPGTHGEAVDPNENYLTASSGVKSWLLTLDHKRIGVMYLIAVIMAFAAGGVFALLLRLELFSPGRTIMGPETYNRMFTLHGAIMVFLFIIPSIPAALGNFFVPIMLGAKDVAFPRLNLLSFYIYLLGSAFALFSIVAGAVDTGWTFYTPYAIETSASVVSMVMGAFILGFSSILTGLNFIVTVHKLRAPGLTWKRLPLFVWGMYATAIIQVLATPVLAITLLLLAMERVLGLGIFDPRLGGDPVLFQHFFWFYSHPAVYIMIVPGMAVVSELFATFSRRAIFGYFAIAMSSLGLALLGFLVWGHHMFVSGQSEFSTMAFSALTFLVAIPSGVKVFNWTATLYKGSIALTTPMLYALSFLVLFTIGGLPGLFLGTLSTDVHLHDTYFVVAHFHYVMMGGTVMGFLGGVWYWWPKMTGKMLDERLGKLHFWLLFIGFQVTFLIQHWLGVMGMPRRYGDYLPSDGFQTMNEISSLGAALLGVSTLVFIWNVLKT
ncbi:MAG: cbb3-type cytochrome c oxidase subunit I, partial [Deltaproteobacteria bacterium]